MLVVWSPRPPSSRVPKELPMFRRLSMHLPLPISQPRDSTEKRLPKTWTRMKSSSTWRKACSTQEHTAGRTSSEQESRGFSTVFIPGSSGTNTIRHIMSKSGSAPCNAVMFLIIGRLFAHSARTTHHPKSFKATSSIYSIPILCKLGPRLYRSGWLAPANALFCSA
jgi:hypothetical protein